MDYTFSQSNLSEAQDRICCKENGSVTLLGTFPMPMPDDIYAGTETQSNARKGP